MRIKKYPSSVVKAISTASGAGLVSEVQLTIGVAPVALGVPPIDFCFTFLLINRSAGGQIIRAGFAPGFAPNFGISLLVNDVVIFENVVFAVSAVANGAGALLDTFITFQSLK